MCSGNEAKLDFDLSVGLETEAFEAIIETLPLPLSDCFFVFATSIYEKFIRYAMAIALYFNMIAIFLYVVETWHCHEADVPTPGHGKGDGARKIRVIAKR